MQIKRDYSQPFFSSRRRRRSSSRLIFLFGLFIGGFLVFVNANLSQLQLMALDAVGFAPTATPFASTWAEQGSNFFLQGKLEDAAKAFAQAVSQQPDNVNYIYEYGRVLIELNRPADPENDRPIDDAQLAVQLGEHAIEVAPEDVRSYTLKSKALYWIDDSQQAIPVALQGFDLNPNFAPLLAVLALTYTDIGRYQQGLKYGEAAITADPMSVEAHRAYAISLILVGERDAAIGQLEDAININPNLTGPYFELAGQFLGASLYEDAVATYEKILTMDPRSAKALLRLCETYSRVGQDEQAEGYCDDALAIDENYKEAYRQLGMVNFRRRNYEDAIKNFDKCVALKSEEIECYYIRGLAHYYIGECDQAWTILKDEALPKANELADKEPIINTIQAGLQLITENCNAYQNVSLPTAIPPTGIPPTPLGLGG